MRDPRDYLEENCQELEVHRVLTDRQSLTEAKQAAMEKKLDSMQNDLTEIKNLLKQLVPPK